MEAELTAGSGEPGDGFRDQCPGAGEASRVGLKVRCSAEGVEETALRYEPGAKHLQRAGNGEDTPQSRVEAPFELLPSGALRLRVFRASPCGFGPAPCTID